MRSEHFRGAAHKNFATLHPHPSPAASNDVAAFNVSPLNIDRRLNMREMTKFAHPIELSDKELDLVAAGWNKGGNGGNGNGVFQAGLINLNDVASNDNINVSLFSNVFQAQT
jgi:hypothetical protein